MQKLLEDVKAFHVACGIPILTSPQFPSEARVALRISLVEEEVNNELVDALVAGDIVGVADAIADSIYVLAGMALEFGIPLDKVWDEVQRANMAKVDPVTGFVRRREDGKVLKPEGWQGPDIYRALGIRPDIDIDAIADGVAA